MSNVKGYYFGIEAILTAFRLYCYYVEIIAVNSSLFICECFHMQRKNVDFST